MSVKKLLALSAAGVISVAMTSALAGGPEMVPAAPPAASENGIYIQADLGYLYNNWDDLIDAPLFVRFGSNKNGGFTFGGAIGYQINRFLAIELGSFYVPRSKWTFGAVLPLRTGRITAWFIYAAGKLMMPLPWVDNLDLFFKAGVAYRETKVKQTGGILPILFSPAKGDDWRPLFGAGAMYRFNDNWYVKVQYLYIAEGRSVNFTATGPAISISGDFHVPAYHIFLGGLGYLFNF